MKLNFGEGLGRRFEVSLGPGLFRLANDGKRRFWFAVVVLLLPNLPIPPNSQRQCFRQGVYYGYSYAMQTT